MDDESRRHDWVESILQYGSSEPRKLPLEYLREITNNFSEEQLLGEGGFGKVYKGVLKNGEMIAVKKLALSITGVHNRQFENEACHLMRLKHPNIVLLLGCCSETENVYVEHNGRLVCAEKSERLLCLEYMPKGSLRQYLSDESSGLAWDIRYKIIEGICHGLQYLHEHFSSPIIHMDLKPANILLDDNMVPKIADFGLSRLFTEEKTRTITTSRDGTLGYMAPEYINRGLITIKLDIFSLGVIIIEIITGRRDYPDDTEIDSREFIDLVLWKWRNLLQKEQGYISLEKSCQQIRRCIKIGLICVKLDRAKRPTTGQIINMLQGSGNQDDVDCLLEDRSVDSLRRCMDASKGFGFAEVARASAEIARASAEVAKARASAEVAKARASTTKVVCCDFSSDGRLLATGGFDKKVILWCTESDLKPKSALQEHSFLITDVRFSPSISRFATSSFDKTVRVWDADNTDYSLRTFTGHSASVKSLDFHPNKEDMICSCDSDGEVRSWSINSGSCLTCIKAFKEGAIQMRFQPHKGKYLAAASDTAIYILDGETQNACRSPLQGHNRTIQSVCWDSAGDFLASVSLNSVRIWSFTSGHDGEFVHELNCSGNKFYSCVFHPTCPSLLVIGCYESLELWDIREKNTMTFNNAHDGLISALAASSVTGKIASVSHDKFVKLWK